MPSRAYDTVALPNYMYQLDQPCILEEWRTRTAKTCVILSDSSLACLLYSAELVFCVGKSEGPRNLITSSWHRTEGSPVLHAVHLEVRMYAHLLLHLDTLGRQSRVAIILEDVFSDVFHY